MYLLKTNDQFEYNIFVAEQLCDSERVNFGVISKKKFQSLNV